MYEPIPPELINAIRKLFFGRLVETSRDLMNAATELAIQINEQDRDNISTLLADMENRIHAMRSVLTVFDECLED